MAAAVGTPRLGPAQRGQSPPAGASESDPCQRCRVRNLDHHDDRRLLASVEKAPRWRRGVAPVLQWLRFDSTRRTRICWACSGERDLDYIKNLPSPLQST